MKKILLFALLLFSKCTFAAVVYACSCGVGAAGGCTPGSQTSPYDTPAKSINTIAQWKTSFIALNAGDHLSTCQGGAFDGVATGNMTNTNATKANPIVIDSYNDTARWVGGAGIKPKFNNTSATTALSINSGSAQHTEGYTIKDIEIVGDGVNTLTGIGIGADKDNVIISNVKVSGAAIGIQCVGGSLSNVTPSGSLDGLQQHLYISGSTIVSNRQIGILAACYDTRIEGNTFANNGVASNLDHDIYGDGLTIVYTPQTISSLTGDGVTSTLVTSSPHFIPVGAHASVTVTGASDTGYNVSNAVATVINATTLTFPSTGSGSSAGASYTDLVELPVNQVVIRNNSLSEAYLGGGNCSFAHIVFHGDWRDVLIEDNAITESAPGAACAGVEIDDGGYPVPTNYQTFKNIVIRTNTILGMGECIAVDESAPVLIENNYCAVHGLSDDFGIRMRAKNFVPGTIGSSTLPATGQSPNNVTIRYNTVYMTAPNGNSWGITLNGNIGDPLTGLHHNVYGNVVVLGSTATANTECFDMQNMTAGMFDVVDYNACYYLGATLPKWSSLGTLAAVQALGLDTHSTIASTASVTTGQPFFTSPTTGPNISTSSALKGAGHPTLGPKTGWGASKRHAAPWDIGAFSFGDTLGVVPNSPAPP